MFELQFSQRVDKIFAKLGKKNRNQLQIIDKKLTEILQNPLRYKMLKGDMKGACRVHIDSHFVLVFELLLEKKVVRVLDYEHHDKIYRGKKK